jgi:hypothetical protein
VAGRDRSGTVAFFSTLATGWQQSSATAGTGGGGPTSPHDNKNVKFERSEPSTGAASGPGGGERKNESDVKMKLIGEEKLASEEAHHADGGDGDEVAKASHEDVQNGLSSPERREIAHALEKQAAKARRGRLGSSASAIENSSNRGVTKEKKEKKKKKKGSERVASESEDPGSDADSSTDAKDGKKRTFKSLVPPLTPCMHACRLSHMHHSFT